MMTNGEFCSDKDLAKCREEHDAAHLEWACDNCPKIREWEPHPYTAKLLNIRQLAAAGFPLDPEMLTYEEWLDLGRINQCLIEPSLKLG